MSYPKNALVVAMFAVFVSSCGKAPETPVPDEPPTAEAPSSPLLQEAEPVPTQEPAAPPPQPPADENGNPPPELLALYQKLNMRSFRSSFGPRLKHFCESYPFEYFPEEGVQVDSPTQMTLVSGNDTWVIELLGDDRIRLVTMISGPGSYFAENELDLETVDAAGDIRADADWIEQRADCKPLNADRPTARGLYDMRASRAADGWICGDYWGGGDVTPEFEHWKTLPKLPREQNPGRNSWGAADMLRIRVIDHASMSGRCGQGEQLREVRVSAIFDQPLGAEVGTFVRIWTYAGGMLDMAGFTRRSEYGNRKVYFDTIAKEQLVLLISGRNEDWIDISTSADPSAWIKLSDFEPHVFAVEYLPYLERLASADEVKLVDSSPRPVRNDASDDAEVVYTLSDTGTAMLPIAIRDEWMQVRFVPPPEYPAIGCGDDEGDFDWLSGWIRWRDGDSWHVTEEHHYGC